MTYGSPGPIIGQTGSVAGLNLLSLISDVIISSNEDDYVILLLLKIYISILADRDMIFSSFYSFCFNSCH